jgi:hypothetical protein
MRRWTFNLSERSFPMAKGQKRSTREIRKPKAAKAKPAQPARDYLSPAKKKK